MAVACKTLILVVYLFSLAIAAARTGNFLFDLMEGDSMVPSDFEKQVSGYCLTTAQILYRRAAVLSLAGLRSVSEFS